ncbi:hypothetical protein M0657_007126 [Pyricularia oryzae]|uniref:Uncharacterized protein n=4 Tax=Pyricularia oryzae TaxID=318829 RepID=Q2KGS6_PYRO7|nr:hypothetical protein MGCH7_ch7g259 [Pyricularia oryzae 70-15]ELQ34266.1 hypothetical protein OOU_Y34scaffold00777g24 [Pyricularia oryzae Y34]KAI7918504.1 hypothetical protein M9X92_006853 [Pyricularia oryzae]KAI7919350.1 hypothetical protein M0657_007126 [Pyricularia oryzae]QBZ66275.1 hypothetical protein PoMZ_13248 [Pyricularia oryzae]
MYLIAAPSQDMQIKWKGYPSGGVSWASAFSPEAKRVTFAGGQGSLPAALST